MSSASSDRLHVFVTESCPSGGSHRPVQTSRSFEPQRQKTPGFFEVFRQSIRRAPKKPPKLTSEKAATAVMEKTGAAHGSGSSSASSGSGSSKNVSPIRHRRTVSARSNIGHRPVNYAHSNPLDFPEEFRESCAIESAIESCTASTSTNSGASDRTAPEENYGSVKPRRSLTPSQSEPVSVPNSSSAMYHRDLSSSETLTVLIIGVEGVGKSSLLRLLNAADSTNPYSESSDNEDEDNPQNFPSVQQKAVNFTPQLRVTHEQMSPLNFIEIDYSSADRRPTWKTAACDSYVIVYSVDSRQSFKTSADILYTLRLNEANKTPVFLVANKVDLVRKTVVTSEEGRALFSEFNCSAFFEVSATLNHMVAELRLAVLGANSIGLQQQLQQQLNYLGSKTANDGNNYSTKPRRRIGGSFKRNKQKQASQGEDSNRLSVRAVLWKRRNSRSCENLFEIVTN